MGGYVLPSNNMQPDDVVNNIKSGCNQNRLFCSYLWFVYETNDNAVYSSFFVYLLLVTY